LAEPGFLAFIGNVTAGVLTSSICMENCSVDAAMSPSSDGHVQTGDDQFGAHMVGRGPRQRPFRVFVPDRAQIHITLTAGHP